MSSGDQSAPAVDDGGVFVSYACFWVHRLDAATGAAEWTHTTDCSGGGGRTPVVQGGEVWVRDHPSEPSLILSEATGEDRGTFASSTAPVFHGERAFLLDGGTLEGVDTASREVVWSQAGDGQLRTAPLSVGGRVYVGTGSGRVFAFDEVTGQLLWSADAGQPVEGPDEHNVSEPLVGLASGDGLLLVPAGNALVAYG